MKMSKLREIKNKIKSFEELQDSVYGGASDTEPDGEFQLALCHAAHGKLKVPQSADDWQLISYNAEHLRKSTPAAKKLTKACIEISEMIMDVSIRESKEVIEYLKDYCWRITW